MAYNFKYDFTRIPKRVFQRFLLSLKKQAIHEKTARLAKRIVKKLRLHELTGLDLETMITLVSDLIEIQLANLENREKFARTKKRALFLPHCARKYLDSRCKARFDEKNSTYICASCSRDCLINRATRLAKKLGYDVYVVAGGSCIPGIIKKHGYRGVVGVACPHEIKLAYEMLKNENLALQAVFLHKNGCANTKFDLEELKRVLMA